MLMLIRHYDGRREEAMVLAVAGNRMRVALDGRDDCTELRLCEGQWVTEKNEAIEIEFMTGAAEELWFGFVDAVAGADEFPGGMSKIEGLTTAVS